MSNTPNLGLELQPSNSLQPSVAINESFKILDALTQVRVQGVLNDPPVTDDDDIGKVWLVGEAGTGEWAGLDHHAALCTAPGLWQYFEPGEQIVYLLRLDNGGFYKWDSGWVLAGGLGDAPADGKLYGRRDTAWEEVPGGGGAGDGIPDAPVDGKLYGRKDASWEEVPAGGDSGIPEAPADGNLYGRKDEGWVVVPAGGGQDTGYATINVQTGTAYTLVLADAGALVTMSNAADNTLTVPPDSAVAFPAGTRVDIGQDGAGQTTVAAGSGVTIRTPETLKLRKQWAKVTLIKRAANTWDIEGNLEAAP